MPRNVPKPAPVPTKTRRKYTEEFRREAVQMLRDGHTANSVAQRLGLDDPTILYRWKTNQLRDAGPVASSREDRVQQLEAELLRVTRERDILKKALAIFGRNE
jgi:transposase